MNTGLAGLQVRSVAVHPTNPAVIYAVTDAFGVQRSVDGGQTWGPTGADLAQVEVLSLAVDPVAPDAVYAGTAGAGVYKSDHWGDAWLPRGPTGTKVASVLLNPLVPGFFYVATEQGVYRTADDGGFWIGVGLHEHDLSALAIDRPLPTRIFASGFAAGVFQSDDGGNSWAVNSLGLGDRAVKSLAAGGAVVFAGTQAGGAFRQASVALPTTTTTIMTTTSTTSTSSTTATGVPSTTTSTTVVRTTTTSILVSTTTSSTATSTTNPSTTTSTTTISSSTTSTTQTPTTLAPATTPRLRRWPTHAAERRRS